MKPDDLENFSEQDLASIEQSTQRLGEQIFERLDTHRPSMLRPGWWDEQVLELAMQDDAVKIQLFRFIDVLPMLRSAEAVVDHLRQYLGEVEERLPKGVRLALSLVGAGGLTGRALSAAIRAAASRQARRFIAGTNLDEVAKAARRQRALGRGFTLDILGEAVTSDVEAERFFQSYLELIEGLSPRVRRWPELPHVDRDSRGPLPRTNISVKLSALDSQADPIDPSSAKERIAPRLRELLRAARQQHVFLNVDMETYHTKDLTLALFQEVLGEEEFRDLADVGIAIQCYLKETGEDLARLAAWASDRGTPVWVRLVKGAYWDYETAHAKATGWPVPVFEQKWQTDAHFERQVRFLLRHTEVLRPAIGSHNIRSLAYALAVAEHLGLPREDLEVQMLYGMADSEKQVLVDMGYRLRVYMPYGELIPGMAYLVRRLLENTSNDSFLRATFTQHVAWQELLRSPLKGRPGKEGGPPRGPGEQAAAGSDRLAEAAEVPQAADATRTAEAAGLAEVTEEAKPTEASKRAEAAGARRPKHSIGRASGCAAGYWKTFANEPTSDFSQEENRHAFQAALELVQPRLGGDYPLVIGGQQVQTDGRIVSLDPSCKQRVVGTAGRAMAEHASLAVRAASAAGPAWAALGPRGRAAYLRLAAEQMRRRRFELAAWIVYECGKPWREADADVCEAIDFCEFYATAAIALGARQEVHVPGEENRIIYLPRGVTAVIAPWNFPLAILTGMTTAALAAGNTVIMKPAEQSPVTAALLMEIFSDLELPAGVLNYLPGLGEEVGQALVEHPQVALVAFTGSQAVGLAINAQAAEASQRSAVGVKRVIAEMGGKNAIIIDEDADLDEAVLGVVRSAFGYQGQKCSACSRTIAVGGVYEPLLERLVEATRSLRLGPAQDPSTRVGPLIDEQALNKVHNYLQIARGEGRQVLGVDVGPLAEQGYFVGPHIFAEVSPEARIAQEEIFGPLLAVIRAEDLGEAIRMANATPYGLTGAVYSRSPANLRRVSRELRVGNLYLNRQCTGALVGRQPFGGLKMSGIGSKAGGPDYLLQFVVPQTITENTMRRGFAPSADAESMPTP